VAKNGECLMMIMRFLCLFLAVVLAAACSDSPTAVVVQPPAEENPFGPNVRIFGPDSANIQEQILQLYATQNLGEFGNTRAALLFKPGTYNLDVRVGYYTQVLGLGRSPDDVTITGAVRTQDDPATRPINEGPGALNNFWRSAENLSIIPTLGSLTVGPPSNVPDTPGGIPLNQNVWAVSQASPLRRIHIKQSPITLTPTECANANFFSPERKRNDPLIRTCPTTLRLFDVGWSSGGFMADSKIDGLVESGSQQQWMSRNCNWTQWNTENWNMVFLGSVPVPAGTWPGTPTSDGAITDGGRTPVVREKPFLFLDENERFFVKLPTLKVNSQGVDWDENGSPGVEIPLESFHIVKPAADGGPLAVDAATINSALDRGQHLLFSPGVYFISDTIRVTRPGTIVLGVGMANLVAANGKPIIEVADVDGVTVAGLTLEAGLMPSPTLLEVGPAGSIADHSSNPTFLFDIFCRVGGSPHSVRATTCVIINSNNVVGDNLWLWRADHGNNVGWTINTADTGLIVNGSSVFMYGLAVEHFQKYQTVWNANFGRVYFYQSEMPYDVPNQAEWVSPNGLNGYASYLVNPAVTSHEAFGLGVYCYFRDSVVSAYHAIEVPSALEGSFVHMLTFWLNGMEGSEVTHVINDTGAAVTKANRRTNVPE
jgi:hypothetical protein